ncbi:MAG: hypothetical protein CL846_09505 [Crocinitomicaceae bacterium]|nr:hypothetical protein [Crocinitomicaceae bacterium]|tara:strand:+ start:2768 stop:3247 length:480 start_codon:yes stop_codon:yes gene_type:complete
MSKNLIFILFIIQLLISCNNTSEKTEIIQNESNSNELDSMIDINKKDSNYTLADSVSKPYNNELETDDKPKIEIVLSQECQQFIDDYSELLSEYELLLQQINEDEGNINLIMAKTSLEDELEFFLSDPVSFRCSNNQNKGSSLFNEELEKINSRKDALY